MADAASLVTSPPMTRGGLGSAARQGAQLRGVGHPIAVADGSGTYEYHEDPLLPPLRRTDCRGFRSEHPGPCLYRLYLHTHLGTGGI
jgi:hypothetical protein